MGLELQTARLMLISTPLEVIKTDGMRLSLPMGVLILVLVAGVTWYILNRTLLGRAVYAIAERLGFSVRTVQLFVFGYAGLVPASSNRLANPFNLVSTELDVIAAARLE
jgi:simple sugar transport system permease protein